jgi:FdhD protein
VSSQGPVERMPVTRWPGGPGDDDVVVEEPLEIRVEDHPLAVTMRTPGDDLDLAAGFLWTEGVIDGGDDLLGLDHLPGDRDRNTVVARLAGGVEAHWEAVRRATRELYATSACGICGKASLDRIRLLAPPIRTTVEVDPALWGTLPERLRAAQATFARTGGLHGAALFAPDGRLELVREDVGRHNAVDKVLGARLRADRTPVDDRLLVVSGRAGFEIVQKARMAGVPAVAAIGAASSLAVELARDAGMILVGFLGPERLVRYA